MALRIVVEGVDIGSSAPDQNGPTLYSGRVRVKIVPQGDANSEAVQMTIPFTAAPSLNYAILRAFTHLHEYGAALQEAVEAERVRHK